MTSQPAQPKTCPHCGAPIAAAAGSAARCARCGRSLDGSSEARPSAGTTGGLAAASGELAAVLRGEMPVAAKVNALAEALWDCGRNPAFVGNVSAVMQRVNEETLCALCHRVGGSSAVNYPADEVVLGQRLLALLRALPTAPAQFETRLAALRAAGRLLVGGHDRLAAWRRFQQAAQKLQNLAAQRPSRLSALFGGRALAARDAAAWELTDAYSQAMAGDWYPDDEAGSFKQRTLRALVAKLSPTAPLLSEDLWRKVEFYFRAGEWPQSIPSVMPTPRAIHPPPAAAPSTIKTATAPPAPSAINPAAAPTQLAAPHGQLPIAAAPVVPETGPTSVPESTTAGPPGSRFWVSFVLGAIGAGLLIVAALMVNNHLADRDAMERAAVAAAETMDMKRRAAAAEKRTRDDEAAAAEKAAREKTAREKAAAEKEKAAKDKAAAEKAEKDKAAAEKAAADKATADKAAADKNRDKTLVLVKPVQVGFPQNDPHVKAVNLCISDHPIAEIHIHGLKEAYPVVPDSPESKLFVTDTEVQLAKDGEVGISIHAQFKGPGSDKQKRLLATFHADESTVKCEVVWLPTAGEIALQKRLRFCVLELRYANKDESEYISLLPTKGTQFLLNKDGVATLFDSGTELSMARELSLGKGSLQNKAGDRKIPFGVDANSQSPRQSWPVKLTNGHEATVSLFETPAQIKVVAPTVPSPQDAKNKSDELHKEADELRKLISRFNDNILKGETEKAKRNLLSIGDALDPKVAEIPPFPKPPDQPKVPINDPKFAEWEALKVKQREEYKNKITALFVDPANAKISQLVQAALDARDRGIPPWVEATVYRVISHADEPSTKILIPIVIPPVEKSP